MTLIPKYLTLSHLVKLGHTKSIDHPSAQVLTGNTLFPISHFGLPLQVFMHKTYKLVQEFPWKYVPQNIFCNFKTMYFKLYTQCN